MVNTNKKTLIINLYGSPSSSKSTIASLVFGKLKQRGVDCELTGEFAKDCVWQERTIEFTNQLIILGEQIRRLNALVGKVDMVICDSPILLNAIYNNQYNQGLYTRLVEDTYKLYNNYPRLNILLERVKPYNPNGRLQIEAESNAIASRIKTYLYSLNLNIIPLKANDDCADNIVSMILGDVSAIQ